MPASTYDAREAYDALAPAYDTLTAAYAYEPWLAALEQLAKRHGLSGRRVLDVACGTGKSFLPLLRRGYEVTACDLSPEMLARARTKVGDDAALHVADIRALPVFGAFDLVTCLDDVLNHLLEPAEVLSALRGMAGNLAPKGLLIFDVNCFSTYRASAGREWTAEEDGMLVLWRTGEAMECPGQLGPEVMIDVFTSRGGLWERRASRHTDRHYPLEQIEAFLAEAGLETVACHGQHPGAVLDEDADEERHRKAVFVARRGASPSRTRDERRFR
jgi:SAM-dependent methyltransferase